MKNVLITGAGGFIGRNVVAELSRFPEEYHLLLVDIDTSELEFERLIAQADFVVHLAGVNRPKTADEFQTGNAGLTEWLLGKLEAAKNAVPVLITSSIQSDLDNDYGKSKREAEQSVLDYGQRNNIDVFVYKLPNVFGKWCRPNYNSAVATFCHNIANGLPIEIHDPARVMTLIYIDDVMDLIKDALAGKAVRDAGGYGAVNITYSAKLGEIAEMIQQFHACKQSLVMPPLGDGLCRALYATYLSYLPRDGFSYPLTQHTDDRGMFAEFFKTLSAGQFSVSTTVPGITRGNHWHHTKVEKFIVVQGKAAIRFRHIDEDEVIEYLVDGAQPEVVDIPPGYTHSISNIGDTLLITLIWANEIFNPDKPDTYFLEV